MTGKLAETWRKLSSETVGTDAYWWIGLQNAAFYGDMKPLVERYARGLVLDAGAGRLAWKDLLLRSVNRYVSGDVAPHHPQLDVVFDATSAYPFRDESFDTVFCCSVLEHATEPWDAFAEMWRVLVPGGRAVVSLPFVLHIHDAPHDYYRFTRYGFTYLAEKAGFEVEEIAINGGAFHLILNIPSMVFSTLWAALGLRSAIRPSTRFWLAVARRLDRLSGLRELFASNHIFVLRKQAPVP